MRKKQHMNRFVVLSRIWSRVHQSYFERGAVVEFPDNPVPDAQGTLPDGAVVVNFDLLVANGVLQPLVEGAELPAEFRPVEGVEPLLVVVENPVAIINPSELEQE